MFKRDKLFLTKNEEKNDLEDMGVILTGVFGLALMMIGIFTVFVTFLEKTKEFCIYLYRRIKNKIRGTTDESGWDKLLHSRHRRLYR